jgi:predicted nuclease of restriction endonuclease-like RecB superfamily
MLTGKMVRVRYLRQHLAPCYLDVRDAEWQEVAERLLHLFRSHVQATRGELEQEIDDVFGDAPNPQIHQGLAKLLEGRCEFAVVSDQPPEQLRAAVFGAAARLRQNRESGTGNRQPGTGNRESEDDARGAVPDSRFPMFGHRFNRNVALRDAAAELGLPAADLERCLFADLRSAQQLISFKDLTPERLLQRYNVALAQAVLLRATVVHVKIRNEPPQRYRQLLRLLKFYQLLCEVEPIGDNAWCLRLDGPLSLFASTQKYGRQLALFLPAMLSCKTFELEAELLWGPRRAAKKFRLTSGDGLISHYVDRGMYVPPELVLFVDLFRKRIDDWEIAEATELLPLGNSFWVPDYQLVHRATGQVVYLEVLGFWRRSSVEKHLLRLRQHAPAPFLLALSEQLHVEEAELEGVPAAVCRFRQMPLPQEIVRAANELLAK